jgi:23S rRNA pseudouridine2604 synthase
MLDNTIRLAKRVAEMIPCSRGEAEQYISAGFVTVNGVVNEEPGSRVSDDMEVLLDPDATLGEIVPVTILLNKEPGVVDPIACLGEATWVPPDHGSQRFLKRHLLNLTVTSPLDVNAGGLVVLTQDFRVSRKLLGEEARVEQEYIVEVSGKIQEGGLALLNHGLSYNNRPIAPMKVSWQNETRLRFALKDVKPGQIANMCRSVGLKIVVMKRIRIGRIPMASLPVGQWRYLHEYEKF